jgi:hemerythrin superfamily protein
MYEVTKLLEHDHREVEQLFLQDKGASDRSIAERICEELTIHTRVEEEIVYPRLRDLDPGMADEAEQEHEEAAQLIEQIRRTDDSIALIARMTELEQVVDHHVQEEEQEVFPRMRSAIGGGDLQVMGRRLVDRKEELRQTLGAGGEPLLDLTKEELYDRAKRAGVEGRSSMTKQQLAEALRGS